jgi:hypothetical protein
MLSTSAPAEDLPLPKRPTQAAVDLDRKDFRMRVVAPDLTRPNRTSPPRKARRGLGAAVAVTVVILLGAGGWSLLRTRHAPEKSAPPPVTPSPPIASPVEPAPVAKPWVKIETEPTGATVIRDGDEIGETPLRIDSPDEKPIKVRFVLEGYEPRDEEILPMNGGGIARFRLLVSTAAPASEKREHHRKRIERPEKTPSPLDRPKRAKDTVTDPFGGE